MVLALHIEGTNLVDSTGKIVKLVGVSAFALFKRFLMLNGWDALCVPILNAWKQVAHEAGYDGPIVLRVFRCAAEPNAFALDPWSYDMPKAAEFTNKCGELGFYVDWTGGDYQLCFQSPDGPRGINQHNNVFCAALIGCNGAIWNQCNEPFKNGVDILATVPPPWAPAVRYSGMYYATPAEYNQLTAYSCINLHTDRGTEGGAEKWVGKAHESAPYLWLVNKPIFFDEPMGADEVAIPGRRSNVPNYFGTLGTAIAMVNAVYFHSTDGIPCNSLRPVTRQCAVAFFIGAAGGIKVPSR